MQNARWIFLLLLTSVAQAVNYPTPSNLFYDGTGSISAAQRAQIQSNLQSTLSDPTARSSPSRSFPPSEGLTVEDYAVQLFSKWGVGMKDKNNGVLILVAINDRKMQIEVGYGLEGSLPDGLCGEIIREQMRPAFKAGQYGKGTLAAAQRITAILTGAEAANITRRIRPAISQCIFSFLFSAPLCSSERLCWARGSLPRRFSLSSSVSSSAACPR